MREHWVTHKSWQKLRGLTKNDLVQFDSQGAKEVKDMTMLRRNLIRIVGILLFLTLFTSCAFAGEHAKVFEKGDVIYRHLGGYIYGTNVPWPWWFLGHAGLYWEWEDVNKETKKPNDPKEWSTHRTIQSLENGPTGEQSFQDFLDSGTFWGVHTSDLDCLDRRVVIAAAKGQIGKARYAFFWDWKNPYGMHDPLEPEKWLSPSFRCDGLVEYCYREAGITILPGEKWWWSGLWYRSPGEQMERLFERTSADPPEIGEITRDWACGLTVPVTDGPYGSGVTMVVGYAEADWQNPTLHCKEARYDNGDCDDPKECLYYAEQAKVFVCDDKTWEQPCYECATVDSRVRVECYDQAGNMSETDWNWEWTETLCNKPLFGGACTGPVTMSCTPCCHEW